MPQNAIIKADGSEDYTSDIAWEAAEQSSDYGSITIARLDGNITRSGRLDFSGTWINNGRIEAFSNDFDGDLNNNPPTITYTGSQQLTRSTSGQVLEFVGVAIVSQSNSWLLDLRTTAGSGFILTDCYLSGNDAIASMGVNGDITLNNCVADVADRLFLGGSDVNSTLNNTTIFTDTSANNIDGSVNDSVIINISTGDCFGGGVAQSNNASSDTTADNLTNLVVSANFVNSDPVSSGNYKISSGSDLDTNTIGAFIQGGGGGISITVTETLNSFADSSTVTITPQVSITAAVTETLNSFSDSSILNVVAAVSVEASITEVLNSFSDSSIVAIVEAGNFAISVFNLY